jgi:AcrR family transcriptional regulator
MNNRFDTSAPDSEAKRPRGRPRKTVDERDDGNRRQAVLAAAAQLFRQKGFSATTTRDIAAAAGMQSGSPFYHFKSKEALLFAVMEAGMHTALARQAAAVQAHGHANAPADQQLRQLVQAHFDVLLGPGNDFVPVMLYESRSLPQRERKLVAQLISQYEALWVPVLNGLHASGQLRAPVGLSRLLMLGALNWSVQWFDPQKGSSVNDLVDAAMALFLGPSATTHTLSGDAARPSTE